MKLAEAFVEVQMTLQDSSVARAKTAVKRAANRMERDGKIKLDADGKPLKKGLDDAERSVERSARSMTATFARLFTGAAVVRGLMDARDAAIDLGESVNAVNVTFGDAADGVHALGEESATSLGLATSEFNALAVRFSAFAKTIAGPGGDVAATLDEMTTRAADFASVMNIDVAEAAELFQSGLAGETEPLRQYGIDLSAAAVEAHAMSIGIGDGTRALTEAEKVQARYSLLMQQTSQVQGDFANTSDSAANQQRILAAEFENAKAKLGTALLPIYSQAITVLTELVEIFSALPAPVQAGIVAMLGIVAVAGPVKDAAKAFTGLSTVVTKLGGAGGPIAALAVGIGVAVLAWKALDGGQLNATPHINTAADALLRETGIAYDAAVAAGEASTEVDALAIAHLALSRALAASADEELSDAMATLNVSGDEWLDTLLALRQANLYNAQGQRILTDAFNFTASEAATFFYLLAQGVNDNEALADATGRSVEEIEAIRGAFGTAAGYAAENADEINAMALAYLQSVPNMGEAAQAALAAAEEIAGSRHEAGNAVPVYEEFIRQLTLMDPAAAAAIVSVDGLGTSTEAGGNAAAAAEGKYNLVRGAIDKSGAAASGAAGKFDFVRGAIDKAGGAAEDAGPDFDAMGAAVGDSASRLDDLSAAADRLRSAIDKVTGPADDMRAATRRMWEETENLTAAFEENGTSLDYSTEAGRANQEQIEANRDAIYEYATSLVQSGMSAEEATEAVQFNIDALNAQLKAAGFTEQQIADLNAEYDLTPDDVATIVRIEGEEFARQTIERYQGLIDEIPESEQTKIEALIEEGDFAEVQRRLDFLSKPRTVQIHLAGAGASPDSARYGRRAAGGYRNSPELAWWAEDGPEAIMPLSRPSRLRELMSDPRIGEPIAAAMGGDAVGITTNVGPTVNVYVTNNGRDLEPEDVARAVRKALVSV